MCAHRPAGSLALLKDLLMYKAIPVSSFWKQPEFGILRLRTRQLPSIVRKGIKRKWLVRAEKKERKKHILTCLLQKKKLNHPFFSGCFFQDKMSSLKVLLCQKPVPGMTSFDAHARNKCRKVSLLEGWLRGESRTDVGRHLIPSNTLQMGKLSPNSISGCSVLPDLDPGCHFGGTIRPKLHLQITRAGSQEKQMPC